VLENWVRDLLGLKEGAAAAHHLKVWGNTSDNQGFYAYGYANAPGTFSPPLITNIYLDVVGPEKGVKGGDDCDVECITYTSYFRCYVGFEVWGANISINIATSTISITICADGTKEVNIDQSSPEANIRGN